MLRPRILHQRHQYDIAHVRWGGKWRIPTYNETSELIDKCTTEWTTLNGVYGRKFTSKINGNSIFLPAAGYHNGSKLYSAKSYGNYLSGTQYASDSNRCYGLSFYNGAVYKSSLFGRPSGLTVRPVTESSNQSNIDKTICDINGDGDVTVSDVLALVQIILNDEEQEEPSVITGEAIDLGLPSGIKWASCNVGATKPEEYGGYYAWGETEEKEVYYWSTYQWCNGSSNTMTKYCSSSSYGTVDNKTVLDPEDDVAHVKWGGNWRMPTYEEIGELIDNCTSEWTTLNGVNGRKFTSNINGNSIFLPAAGTRNGSSLNDAESYGYYWSGALSAGYSYNAYYLDFGSGHVYRYSFSSRYSGHTVRPVTE
ncbi:MAG: hypothetical protein IJK87_15955 [Prevotella sp.]|nr:hypothetical protein [Prevotella sp.]